MVGRISLAIAPLWSWWNGRQKRYICKLSADHRNSSVAFLENFCNSPMDDACRICKLHLSMLSMSVLAFTIGIHHSINWGNNLAFFCPFNICCTWLLNHQWHVKHHSEHSENVFGRPSGKFPPPGYYVPARASTCHRSSSAKHDPFGLGWWWQWWTALSSKRKRSNATRCNQTSVCSHIGSTKDSKRG